MPYLTPNSWFYYFLYYNIGIPIPIWYSTLYKTIARNPQLILKKFDILQVLVNFLLKDKKAEYHYSAFHIKITTLKHDTISVFL